MLCATGQIVWVGCGSLGPNDGRIKLLRRDRAALLLDPPAEYEAPSPTHAAVLQHLQQRGACFTVELSRVTQIGVLDELDALLWDLVWAGQITNDTVQPLRGMATRRHKNRSVRRRPGPAFGGRWYRVHDLLHPPDPTEAAHARATMLLQRYGIACREAALGDDVVGGFTAVYGVLKAMEEAGKVRRGYFVEGLSGAQFAFAGAIERLRTYAESAPDSEAHIVAATDPANPYGSLLPWPQRDPATHAGKLRRVSGAWVVMQHGEPLLFVEPQSRRVLTFPAVWQHETALPAAIEGLRTLAGRRRGSMLHVHTIDGQPAHRFTHAARLLAAGLQNTFDGFLIYGEAGHA